MIKFPSHLSTRFILGFAGFLLIAIPYSIWLPRYTTSNPNYCLRCHGEKGGLSNRGIESRVHPSYEVVPCVDCHSKPNQIVYEGYVGGFLAEAGRVSQNCKRCHENMTTRNDIEGFKFNPDKISIPHKLHLEMGASCTDCHANLSHDLSEKQTNRPRMEYCSQCHATSIEPCAKCHLDKVPSGMIPVSPPAGLVGDGRSLYSRYCSSCHGTNGSSVEGINLHSKEIFEKYDILSLSEKILKGHNLMPSFDISRGGILNQDEVKAIIAHLKLSTAGLRTNGQSLYDNYCAVCHGVKGNKIDKIDFSSSEYVSKLSNEYIINKIKSGKGGMPAFDRSHGGPLSFESILAISKFISTFSQPESSESQIVSGPDGSVLYKLNCTSCHGDKGTDIDGVNLRSVDYLNKLGDTKFFNSTSKGTDAMPAFGKSAGGSLSKDEIDAILSYLKGKMISNIAGQEKTMMKRAPKIPHEVTQDMENCLECHGKDGIKPVPADHAGRTTKICKTCHVIK